MAANMVDRYSLRTLDSLQLATAVVVRDGAHPQTTTFVASDIALIRAADFDGFNIWNPEREPSASS